MVGFCDQAASLKAPFCCHILSVAWGSGQPMPSPTRDRCPPWQPQGPCARSGPSLCCRLRDALQLALGRWLLLARGSVS